MASLEIACFNPQSAIIAAQNGASRIELCANQHLGGTTPSLSDFLALKSQITIPIYVMIRPRGGDFFFSDQENVMMNRSVKEFDDAGADGFVFGILDEDNPGSLEPDQCRHLIWLAKGKPCTFHRAFDQIPVDQMEEELEIIIETGFKGLLTSGGAADAVKGKERLKRLVQKAGNRIDIIVGGGVRSANVEELKLTTEANWYHSSAILGSEGGDVASAAEVLNLREVLDS
jgi:copper homeostasis protein